MFIQGWNDRRFWLYFSLCIPKKKNSYKPFINNDTPDNMLMYPMARSFMDYLFYTGRLFLIVHMLFTMQVAILGFRNMSKFNQSIHIKHFYF